MKKTIAILLVLMLAMTGAFAAIIQIGPTAFFQGTDVTDVEQLKDFSNYGWGVDTRINLGIVDVTASGTISTDFSKTFSANAFTSVNARFELALLELAVGAGTDLQVGNTDGEWKANGQEISSFVDVLKASSFDARIAAGVNLGGLGVNVSYRVPFKTLGEMVKGDYANVEKINTGKTSISLLLNMF